jgi:hypothetical protein
MKFPGLLLVCLLLTLAATAARAQLAVAPTLLGGGNNEAPCCWLHLRIENSYNQPLPLELVINSWQGSQSRLKIPRQIIAPGATVEMDYALPINGYFGVMWENPDGKMQQASPADYSQKIFLHVSATQFQATQAQVEDFAKRLSLTGPGQKIVSQIEARQLPADWLCLTPFRAVMMPEAEYKTLPPNLREPLLTWVRAGGDLLLYQAEHVGIEAQMMGKIRRVADNPLLTPTNTPPEWGGNPLPWRDLQGNDQLFPYRVEISTGNTGGLVLASLFFVLAGPLALWWSNRRKQPHLVLKIVPVLSAAFCIIMLIYFVGSEGFERKGGSLTLHTLDETAQHGITVAHQTLLSGLYPRGGFKFSRTAALVPHINRENRDSASIEMELGPAQRLTRGWFEPRVPFNYTTVLPFETREHLVLEGNKLRNGFETAITGGILYAPGNRRLAIPALKPGANAAAAPLSAPANNDGLQAFLTPDEATYLRALLPALRLNLLGDDGANREFYIVKLAGPWGQAKDGSGSSLAGVEINGPQTHILIGLRSAGQAEATHAPGA